MAVKLKHYFPERLSTTMALIKVSNHPQTLIGFSEGIALQTILAKAMKPTRISAQFRIIKSFIFVFF